MSDVEDSILDAAERRMRRGGFDGFSFREIAADVGIKSSSVHYHFPTKEHLAAAVIRHYIERVAGEFDQRIAGGMSPSQSMDRNVPRNSAFRGNTCVLAWPLGAAFRDLPTEVAKEVKRFFQMILNKLITAGYPADQADEVVATITGGLMVANALNDFSAYDRAVSELVRALNATAASRPKSRKKSAKRR